MLLVTGACGGPEFRNLPAEAESTSSTGGAANTVNDVSSASSATTAPLSTGSVAVTASVSSGGAGGVSSSATLSTTDTVTNTTGALQSCSEIASCADEPSCSATLGASHNACRFGSYTCGSHQGYFTDDWHDFPCDSSDAITDCTQASQDLSSYLQEHCSSSAAQSTSTESSTSMASASSTTGDSLPEECGCGTPGQSGSAAQHSYACLAGQGCTPCPNGFIDCDGDFPEPANSENRGCETSLWPWPEPLWGSPDMCRLATECRWVGTYPDGEIEC